MSENYEVLTRNRSIVLQDKEKEELSKNLITLSNPMPFELIRNKTINQDTISALQYLPDRCVDLLFADPPYNLTKDFNGNVFKQTSTQQYAEWLETWMSHVERLLKPNASLYVCGDWRSSSAIQMVLEKKYHIRNRITWEREKGRGAQANWKNASEDIWFATVSEHYVFNVDKVKLRKKVLAPYKDDEGKPKDWKQGRTGNFRFTYPSNVWTDLTVPFWSMSENTNHPTQKPEKLLAKIILASSDKDDFILDPFLGSGTTSVVAKKLGRNYCGIEMSKEYCLLAEKRLAMAEKNKNIQGFNNGIFLERNCGN